MMTTQGPGPTPTTNGSPAGRSWRVIIGVGVIGLVVILGISVGVAVVLEAQEENMLRLAATAKLTLSDALREAETAATGTALEGELAVRHGRTVYVIEVLGDEGVLRTTTVDAESGEVIAIDEH